MVDRVVVNERRQMHQLDHGGQRQRVVAGLTVDRIGEEHECRPEQLPLHEEEVLVDVLDHVEVGQHDPADLLADPVELLLHRLLNGRKSRHHGAAGGAHGRLRINAGHGGAP